MKKLLSRSRRPESWSSWFGITSSSYSQPTPSTQPSRHASISDASALSTCWPRSWVSTSAPGHNVVLSDRVAVNSPRFRRGKMRQDFAALREIIFLFDLLMTWSQRVSGGRLTGCAMIARKNFGEILNRISIIVSAQEMSPKRDRCIDDLRQLPYITVWEKSAHHCIK